MIAGAPVSTTTPLLPATWVTRGGSTIFPSDVVAAATSVFRGGTSSLIGQMVVYHGMVEVCVLAGQYVAVPGQSVTVMQVVV